ncbi:hypothetical protein H257_14234 [Aphanomyces astaci]|uniref:Peptidase S1 domain-containing protein n=1 Tax=Aphanomyces astaci TaxID=112090 RepID=W4FRV3_APHAT|nr:hypothetical protein H257_14234 [Aphanomyces astaci]ETV70202.1 hypothetical protein H257_14234 [Aphanomyces astaci]RQM11674.1 hypothetical protein B5M09_013948 [Aphanomyces astaci]|eukprot:XP_009840298.1 hypothetical protein H257_14234 [Aphanomyces astaci]
MKFALLLAFTVAVAALTQDQVVPAKVACGDEAPYDGFEILGGKEAKRGEHRYVTGFKKSPDGDTVCGGSLIAPNVVLTAAHCLKGFLPYAVVGTHFLTGYKDGELATVIEEIKHPNPSVDVGIAILNRNITNIEPVKLLFEKVPSGVYTWARGWGQVRHYGPQSSVLMEVILETWSNDKASDAFGTTGKTVTDTMLAAGGVEGEDMCDNDSGGPLTTEVSAGVRLVGVASWGRGCGRHGKPGVYERVSASRDFIEPYLPK